MARRIPDGQVAFLKFELTRGNPKRKKVALQELCALYRRGSILSSGQLNEFEAIINGIVLATGQDLKVVRWCLNALAQFGRLSSCGTYVELALARYRGDAEIEAGGVAALCRMYRGSVDDIASLTAIDPITWKLAALQNTAPSKLDIGNLKIDIYNTAPAVLRLALITVGLNKDIENLFHPRHTNAAFVRHLGQHDDPIVQQYSVWSVIENRRLTFDDLGIPVDQIEGVPANVQAKMYQLIAERDMDMHRRLATTSRGALVGSSEAREGLAKGIRANYYDGLEEVTIDWFRQEQQKTIRELLAEHIGRYADVCRPYNDLADEIIESDPSLTERLLLGAEGKPLYGRVKGTRSPDLFSEIGGAPDLSGLIQQQRQTSSTPTTIKALLLTASPLDETSLRVDEEYREIKQALRQISRPKNIIDIDLNTAVRASDILSHILNSDAEIFHFSGHGDVDCLVFEDAFGQSKSVNAELIIDILSKRTATVRCAILNACSTATLADGLSAHLPCVIGCDTTIDDAAAISFSRSFYQALAAGHSYRQSFELAVAEVKANVSPSEAKKYIIRQNN